MPLTKYARFEVLSAELAPNRLARTAGRVVNFRHAHRHAFQYDPKPGFLYVRSRAISSRCNDNFDEFPAEEIKKAYATFIGKPVFVNHNNSNHRRMRGVCIAAALHEDINPDGSPDTWTEVLMEIDAVRFPKLAQAILAGHIDRTSMGTDVAYSLCSFCGNRATTPLEYCAHIPKLKGKRIRRTLASGAKEDVLVREICHGLRFFENSVLVEPPADPTAFAWIDSADMVPTQAVLDAPNSLIGYPEARGDLRQRDLSTLASAGGSPLQKSAYFLDLAFRELGGGVPGAFGAPPLRHHVGAIDGVGAKKPALRVLTDREVAGVAHDQALGDRANDVDVAPAMGAHTGASFVREAEARVPVLEDTAGPGPAGIGSTTGVDLGEVPLHLRHRADPASRSGVDHRHGPDRINRLPLGVETGPGVTASRHTAALDPEAIKDGARRHARKKKHYISNWSHGGGGWLIGSCGRCGATIGCHPSGALSPSPTINQPCTGSSDALSQSGAPSSTTNAALRAEGGWEETRPGRQEWVGPREDLGVLKGKALIDHMQERHSYVVWNPPAPNTKRYKEWKRQHDEDNHGRWAEQSDHTHGPAKESALSRAAAFIDQAMQVEAEQGNNLTIDFFGIQQTCTSEQASLVLDFLMASRQAGYTHQPKTDNGFEDIWVIQYPWTPEEVGGESMAQARRDFLVEKGIPAKFMKVSSRHHAYGEVVAPAKVDTLRDEVCPVCGESDSFDGDKCMVCGYVKPPDEFMDPDLDKARNTDLRQEQDDDLNLGDSGDLTCENCGQDYLSKEMAGDDPLGSDANTGDEYQDAESNPVDAQTDDDNAAKPDTNPDTDPAKLPHLNKPKKPDVEDAAQPDGKLPKSKDTQTKQKAGDTCPSCGKGTLKPKGDAKGDGNAFVPPTGDKASPQDGAEDQDETQDDDDKDGKGKKKPPWMKGDKKAGALSRAAYLVQRCEADEQKENSMRPALAALAEQQRVITAQDQTINRLRGAVAFIAEAAGLSEHPAITSVLEDDVLQSTADVNNPAQPVPDPASQGPVETTEQALAPAGRDDPESIGASPVANTAPAATTSLDEVGGTVANDPLDLNEEDVTAPVAGTEGPRPLNEVKTEVEQRIGPWQGNDPAPAFPLQGPFAERASTTGSVTEGRTIACLRLARLRMQAGIASEATDDLSFGTEIANSDMSDELVQAEIDTLSKVVTQAGKRQPVSRSLVPQAAPARAPQPVTAGVQRTTPSMAAPQPGPRTEAPGPIQATAASMSPDDTEFLFE